MNTYTELETTVMTAIKNAKVSFFDDGVEIDSNGWFDSMVATFRNGPTQ